MGNNSTTYILSVSIRIIGPIISGIAGLLLARELGPELYGKIAVILSIIFVGGVFSEFGLPGIATLYFKQEEVNSNSIVKSVGNILLFSTLVSIFLCSIFYISRDNQSIPIIELLAITFCLLPYVYSYEKYWIDSSEYRFFTSNLEAVSLVVFSITKLIVVSNFVDYQYVGVLLVHIIQVFFIVACRKIIFYKRYRNVEREEKVTTHTLLEGAKYLSLSSICIACYSKLDIIMIGLMRGDGAAGNYAIMVAFFGFLTMPSNVFSQLFYPELIKEKGSEKWLFIIRLFSFYSILVLAAILLFLDDLYVFLFDDIYSFNSYVGLFLGMSIIFHGWAMVSSKLLTIKGFYRFAAIRTSIALMLNALLNFFLIPIYGESGAAFATFISYLWLGFGSDLPKNGVRNMAYLKVFSFSPVWRAK